MGTWSHIDGGTVPQGNGDIPAVGSINRVYARVRNFGTVATTDVKVTFQLLTLQEWGLPAQMAG
jgi:hypothetical protein